MNGMRPGGDLPGFADRLGAIIGMHEVEIRLREQLLVGEPEHPRPRGVEPLEVPVESCETEQIERHRKESIELLFRAAPLDELADLAADRVEHREEVGIRLPDFAA